MEAAAALIKIFMGLALVHFQKKLAVKSASYMKIRMLLQKIVSPIVSVLTNEVHSCDISVDKDHKAS